MLKVQDKPFTNIEDITKINITPHFVCFNYDRNKVMVDFIMLGMARNIKKIP